MSVDAVGRPGERGLRVGGGLVGAAGVLAAVQMVLVNVGTSLIDADSVRPWAWLVWSGIVVLAVAGVAAGVVLYRRDSAAAEAGVRTAVVQRAKVTGAGASSTQIGRDQNIHFHPPSEPPPAPSAVPAAMSNLPRQNPAFTGRIELLDQIGKRLESGPVAVVAVRGMGGVGKTQAAIEYAHRGRAAGRYDLTWWIRAETDLSVVQDLAALAPALGVPAEQDLEDTAAGVRAALQQRPRWLVVFDNAPDPAAVRDGLPDGPGHVLITSRDRGWATLGTQLDVEVFTRHESLAYLRERLGRADPDADTLADTLGDLPLALAQSASWLDLHGRPSAARYLHLYTATAGAGRLLAEDTGDGYPHTVATTWLIHFTELSATNPTALELLRLCAWLNPDDIPLDLILSQPDLLDRPPFTAHLAAAATTETGREDLIGALTRASLVTRIDGDRIRIHRLVADITRRHPNPTSTPSRQLRQRLRPTSEPRGFDAAVLHLLANLLPDEPSEPATWPTYAQLTTHARSAANQANIPFIPPAAVVLGKLGLYLQIRAEYRPARDSLRRALAIFEAVYGPEHPQVAITLNNLGVVQRELRELSAAQATLERALAIKEAVYGPAHPEVAITLTNLSSVHQERWDLPAAQATLERALTIKDAKHGPAHPQVATTLTNLGILQRRLRDLPAARATLERALAIKEAVYGPDHLQVAITLTNLGNVQRELGELPAAQATLERALAINKAVYGPEHPRVGITLGSLGKVQRERGELPTAYATLRQALKIFAAAYGPEHPYTVLTLALLAELDTTRGV